MRTHTYRSALGASLVVGLLLASGVVAVGQPPLPSSRAASFETVSTHLAETARVSASLERSITTAPASSGATSPAAFPSCASGASASEGCTPSAVDAQVSLAASPTWNNATPNIAPPSPPAAIGASAAYDPLLGGTLYFGGCSLHSCPGNRTWLYADGSWTNLTASTGPAPPPRMNASLVYYPPARELVLFGGLGAGNKQLQDTWTYANGSWQAVTVTPAHPPARWAAGMTLYNNSTTSYVLLFGGCGGFPCGGLLADTWEWTATAGWIQLRPPTSPSPRGGVALAMDGSEGVAVLAGGGSYSNGAGWTCPAGYWTYVDGVWTLHAAGAPTGRGFASLTEDLTTGQLLLFGGINGTSVYNDTWTFAGGVWNRLSLADAPSPREGAAASDSAPVPVIVGGACSSACGPGADTWVFEVPPTATASASPITTDAGVPITFDASGAGGTVPYRYVWSFGDTSTSDLSVVSHAYASSGTFDVVVTAVDALGVSGSSSVRVTVHDLPVLGFTSGSAAGDVGLPASWSVAALANGTTPDAIAWTFGDGSSAVGDSVTHGYNTTGVYNVTATLTDAVGQWCTVTAPFQVNPALTVAISTVPAQPIAGQPVVFFAGTSGGTSPMSVAWSFGDNGTSTLSTPSYVYVEAGNETVTVTVTDAAGGSVAGSLLLHVDVAPVAGNSLSPWLLFGVLTSVAAIALAVPALWLHYRRKAAEQRAEENPSANTDDPWMTARRRVRRLKK